MFFDIGWPELMLIGAVALIVIGPKELPNALRTAGFWVRKARSLSREFQSSVEQMMREAELDEMRKQLKKATEFDIEKEFKNTVDPTGELAQSIKPPEIPDFFDPAPQPATAAATPAAAQDGLPVYVAPAVVGFDEAELGPAADAGGAPPAPAPPGPMPPAAAAAPPKA